MQEFGTYINWTVLSLVAGGLIKLFLWWQKERDDMHKKIDVAQKLAASASKELEDKLDGHEANSVARSETSRRETGEVGQALRTKIHEVETWARDTFVRKDSFEIVVNRLEKTMEKIGDKIDEKFDRMEKRLERREARTD